MPQGQVISLRADSTTLVINGYAITDFVAGDYITIAPVNPKSARIQGANGTAVIKKRVDGDVYDITINVVKYSDSDIYLNNLMNSADAAPIDGSCKENIKKNGQAVVSSWSIENGTITTAPTDTQNNQDGNAAMAYVIQCNATRLI